MTFAVPSSQRGHAKKPATQTTARSVSASGTVNARQGIRHGHDADHPLHDVQPLSAGCRSTFFGVKSRCEGPVLFVIGGQRLVQVHHGSRDECHGTPGEFGVDRLEPTILKIPREQSQERADRDVMTVAGQTRRVESSHIRQQANIGFSSNIGVRAASP